MTDNTAILEGYTRELHGHAGILRLCLLVKPDEVIGERFRAYDMDRQEFIMVNGWLFSWVEIESKGEAMTSTAAGITAVLELIVEAVKESGAHGMPGGSLYAALMAYGCSFSMYQDLMDVLLREGRVAKRGQLYFVKEN